MEDEVVSPRRISRNSRPGPKRRSVLFLELLPVVKQYIDKMTVDDIRERWNDGSDRRSVNLSVSTTRPTRSLTLSGKLVSLSTSQTNKRSS